MVGGRGKIKEDYWCRSGEAVAAIHLFIGGSGHGL